MIKKQHDYLLNEFNKQISKIQTDICQFLKDNENLNFWTMERTLQDRFGINNQDKRMLIWSVYRVGNIKNYSIEQIANKIF